MTNEAKRWEAVLEEDQNGDLILPLPQEMLDQLGWKEGDDLEWKVHENGSIELFKASATNASTSTVDRVC